MKTIKAIDFDHPRRRRLLHRRRVLRPRAQLRAVGCAAEEVRNCALYDDGNLAVRAQCERASTLKDRARSARSTRSKCLHARTGCSPRARWRAVARDTTTEIGTVDASAKRLRDPRLMQRDAVQSRADDAFPQKNSVEIRVSTERSAEYYPAHWSATPMFVPALPQSCGAVDRSN